MIKILFFKQYRLRYCAVLLFFLGAFEGVHGQVEVSEFFLSANDEPTLFQRAIQTEKGGVYLTKKKGNEWGKSEYLLSLLSSNFSLTWQDGIKLGPTEDIVLLEVINNEVLVYKNQHDLMKKRAILSLERFNLASGQRSGTQELANYVVNEWQDYSAKGSVKLHLQDMIEAKQVTNYVVPLNYQFHISRSQDKSKLLVYWYNHSQKDLRCHMKLFDGSYSLLSEGDVPIDRGFVSHGVQLNNRGDVYIYKVNKVGKVALVQYDLSNKTHKYLSIEGASSARSNLKIVLKNDDEVYLAMLNKKGGVLQGVSYVKFDFLKEEVALPHYQDFNYTMRSQILSEQEHKGYTERDDWKYFEIATFKMHDDGSAIIILEERRMESQVFVYDDQAINHLDLWQPQEGMLSLGTVLLLKFNEVGDMVWFQSIVKNQENNLQDGMKASSFVYHESGDRSWVLFASGKLFYNELNLVEINQISGEKQKDVSLKNPEKLVIQRAYTTWRDDGLLIVGKKGVMGKKSMLKKFLF